MIRGKSASESSISAKIIRKDGRVEDLGVIVYWHRSWIKRMSFRVNKWVEKVLKTNKS